MFHFHSNVFKISICSKFWNVQISSTVELECHFKINVHVLEVCAQQCFTDWGTGLES